MFTDLNLINGGVEMTIKVCIDKNPEGLTFLIRNL
jgi:hypothetical protein